MKSLSEVVYPANHMDVAQTNEIYNNQETPAPQN